MSKSYVTILNIAFTTTILRLSPSNYLRCLEKQSLQKTSLPSVGLNGTSHSSLHPLQVVLCIVLSDLKSAMTFTVKHPI
jgi:hypothetical protein